MRSSESRQHRGIDAKATARRLLAHCLRPPQLALMLGSGMNDARPQVKVLTSIPYECLPGFPALSVTGHAGEVVIAESAGTPLLLLCGRAHYYEGFTLNEVTFPIRVLADCGIRDLVLTNAAGAISPRLRPGDLMLVSDHLNFLGANPLRGPSLPGRERFVDMTCTYDPRLRRLLRGAARSLRFSLPEGVYLAVSGPSFETPAEIRAFARWGADAVGMSTVPEVIVARQCGLSVAALSCITNLAAGRGKEPLSHHEVLAVGRQTASRISRLLTCFLSRYAEKRLD